jgi:Prokaryotic N-terminal methylation motif
MLQFFAKRLKELHEVERDERGFTLIELLVVVFRTCNKVSVLWMVLSANFSCDAFCELRFHGVLRSSPAWSSRKTTLCTAAVQHLWAGPG